jgi:galactonate dehydratase
MKLADLEIFVIGTPPPGWGGRYWIIVKLTTACGISGYGEVYAASVGPKAMRAVIEDVFTRHMAGEDPANVERMFRRAYSSGFTQRPDLTVMGAFSGLEIACWDIVGKALDRPVHMLLGGRMNDRLRAYTYLYPLAKA